MASVKRKNGITNKNSALNFKHLRLGVDKMYEDTLWSFATFRNSTAVLSTKVEFMEFIYHTESKVVIMEISEIFCRIWHFGRF